MSTDRLVSLIPLPESTSEYIKIFNSFLVFCLKMLPIVIVISSICGYLFYKKELKKPIYYEANLSFVETSQIENSSSVPFSPEISFLSQSRDKSNNQIIEGIIKSDAVFSRALFKPVSESNDEMLINYYLDQYDNSDYKDSKFLFPSLDSLGIKQTKIYNQLKKEILKPENNIFNFQSDGINQLTIKSTNETISLSLANNIFDALSEFYQQNSFDSYHAELKKMVYSRDSTYSRLKDLQSQLAQDATKNSGFNRLPNQRLYEQTLREKIELTQELYTQYFSRVEAYKVGNQSAKPVFRKLNVPILPLSKSKNNPTQQAILGLITGFALGLFFIILVYFTIVGRKIYVKAKNQDED